MKEKEYIRVLAEFVTGEVSLEKLKELVEERLFDLRQSPEMTREKELLSGVELRLHEFEEGYTTASDVYAYIQSVLDNIILPSLTSESRTAHISSRVPTVPFFVSKSFDIDDVLSRTEQTVTKEFSPVGS
jgi:hypothetical protein